MILPRTIVIMCGGLSMEWGRICDVMRSFKTATYSGRHFYKSPFTYMWKIEVTRVKARRKVLQGRDLSLKLEDLLVLFMEHWEATRPHDRVYGLLGLAQEKIQVDYTYSSGQLFREIEPFLKDPAARNMVWEVLCRSFGDNHKMHVPSRDVEPEPESVSLPLFHTAPFQLPTKFVC
jgi:hypothetical protein